MTGDADLTTAGADPHSLPLTTHWDRVAETTNWGRYLTEVEKQVILKGEALAENRGRAVDMGCGGGRWSRLLHDRGWDVTCADVNSESLAVCQQKVPSAKCILTKPTDETIPVDSGAADLILCIEVIPLIESDWFIAEANRALSDNGMFIGVYINGRSLRALGWRLKQWLTGGEDGDRFYRASYLDWKRRLLGSGFEMVHEESCCWGPFTRGSNSPFVPVFTKFERAVRLNRVVSWSPWVVFIARKTRRERSAR
jgi:SAM-dependent methyltransferase